MPKFVPDNFKPRQSDIEWAMKKFNISRNEADNQLEEFIDYEFKRSYTDWNRCFRNWFRTADKYNLLKREHKYRTVETITDEQKKCDILRFEEQIKRFGK